MSIVILLVGVAAIGAVAVVLAGRTGGQVEFAPDRAPFELPAADELSVDQIETLRFSVGFRGYRMDQVDEVLDRMSAALVARDRQIAELQARELGLADDDAALAAAVAAARAASASAEVPIDPPVGPPVEPADPPARSGEERPAVD